MTCCTYFDDHEVRHYLATLDDGLRELFDEVRAKTGTQLYVWHRKFETGRWWWKRTVTRYELLHHVGSIEYQVINFGPPEAGGASFGYFANRQAIAAYLFGYLNGYRAGVRPE